MEWVVEQSSTLKDFLEHRLLSQVSSKKGIKKLLDQGLIAVNDKVERFGKVHLKKGDRVSLLTLQLKSSEQSFDPSKILFEDPYFLIYDKPCGIVSDGKAFLDSASTYCPHLVPIHRLDKETSGILMLAKTPEILASMIDLYQKKEVKKTYLAWVSGHMKQKKGRIDEPIGIVYREGTAKRYGVKKEGKPALTLFDLIEAHPDRSLLHLYPITGRTHQLRVHLNFIGHSILGDPLYGRAWGSRLFLHASAISFIHPITHEQLTITSPSDF